MNKVIIGKDLVKSYGEGDEKRHVLDSVSIEINEGEFIAIMGPSGSGKSTLLYALSGMDQVDNGSVIFDSKELSELNEEKLSAIRRTKMGFVFQQPTMLKNLNILDNIILPAMRNNQKNGVKIVEKARELMKSLGIGELESRDITQVSGGQLQRAGICRALLNHPKIIFGDEPTGALNSKSSQEIMDLFSEIHARGTTIMFVTHDAKVAARTERILFMRDGKVVSEMSLPKYKDADMTSRMEKIATKMVEIGI